MASRYKRKQGIWSNWPRKSCKHGHYSPRNKGGNCIECAKILDEHRVKNGIKYETHKQWQINNREYANKHRREYNRKNPLRKMVAAAKINAKVQNVPFNITIDDLILPEVCPVLGIKITAVDGVRKDSSPSLDKIIPEKGYTKGNVIVVSWRANRLKNNALLHELVMIARFYYKQAGYEL